MGMAESFKALSDPQRREVLLLLRNGRCTAGSLAEQLQISPSALSYHLKTLKKAEMGFYDNQGQYVKEDGLFRIYVGGNSKDCLCKEIRIQF